MKRKVTYDEAVEAVRTLIEYIGDDPDRDGLKETPDRVVRSYQHLFQGYQINPSTILEKRFASNSSEMVVLSNIEMYSICEHHMLPFVGKCHIGYLPKGFVVGISKLARIMEVFARRLQIQEELCYQIANTIQSEIQPYGVAVVIEAQHMCMTCRGVEKQNSIMTSSALLGEFRKMDTRMEFLKLIGK